jgi:phospholipid/cholesterol/gamma-HCH transport system permease protein
MRFLGDLVASTGASAIKIARETGGIAVMFAQVLRSLIPPSMDGRELLRNMYKMGNRSVPIVALTAFFTGALMIIQFASFVKQWGATGLVGWAGGYAVLREVGPILIALMFSGRVGANNTAELGTMTVTEQLDGLRALSIDPIRYLIVPRVVAMMLMLVALTIIGDMVALVGGVLMAWALLDVAPSVSWYSMVDNLSVVDFMHGVYKSIVFGLAIAMTSCYFGITVRGGAVGVGRAVNAAVVAAAVSIMLLDFFMTYLTG